eukprot:372675-Rhodomonas_salina.1
MLPFIAKVAIYGSTASISDMQGARAGGGERGGHDAPHAGVAVAFNDTYRGLTSAWQMCWCGMYATRVILPVFIGQKGVPIVLRPCYAMSGT